MAIAVVVIAMFHLVTRVGMGASLVRRMELTHAESSTFFWASLILGVVAGLLAVLVSNPAAALAGSVEAAPLVAVAALTLPLGLAASVPMGLLSRSLRFRTLTIIQLVAYGVHGVVAVSLALLGLGAWAVVIGQVCRSASVLAGTFVATRFRPLLVFKGQVVRGELSFNAGVLGGDIVSYANKNADYWFVGNQLGTGALGVYYMAYVIPNVLRRRITAVGDQVLFPIISRIQDDKKRIVSAYLRVMKLVAFLAVPSMLGLALVSDLAIRIGFGEEWLEAIAPVRVIAIAAAVTSTVVAARPIFKALGRPAVVVVAGVVSLVALGVGLALVLLGTMSLVGVAFAVLSAAVVEAVVMQHKMKVEFGLRYGQVLTTLGPFVVSAGVMMAAVWASRSYVLGDLAIVPEAAISVAVGVLVYLVAGLVLFNKAFRDQLQTFRRLLSRG